MAKKRLVQILNPKTDRWVKIDRDTGKITGHKKSPEPYKGVPIYEVNYAKKSKVKPHTRKPQKKTAQKKVTLTKANVQAYKKKYPITFYKLAMMAGDPKKKTLISRLPDYNAWLQHHDYDNEAWFRGRNKSKKDW